jgi:hypothetical protein
MSKEKGRASATQGVAGCELGYSVTEADAMPLRHQGMLQVTGAVSELAGQDSVHKKHSLYQ